ncbi:3-oxoadipate enol-lactonase [uncultured Alsobacter sp.]|uniref:bifunctional 3-oxoadipate enol-lactonase/4-carboxymuconolactone decarboxylase PcaDC n=1 Tax=uncultured Alsobacter sp. TaxID=1748258 RepID=UPI0025F0982B|nr:3-oxoadipate enol-lactonase [uncultured Alsobacter sp.]
MPLIAIDGAEIFYDVTGPAGGPAVLFSNSLGTTLEMWDRQARALAGRYRVIRYDTRGHGRSTTGSGDLTIERLALDAAALLGHLGIDRAHVVGLSLGGMTAQALAIHHPERVASLVLMATAPYLPPRENWETRAATVREKGMGAIVDAVLARWFTPAMAQTDPAALAHLRGRFLAVDPEGYAACCLAIAGMDLRPRLGDIAVRTLVVAGADDPVTTPAMCGDLARAIPGAGCEVVPGSAHILNVEKPDEVNGLLAAFLAVHAPTDAARDAFQAGLSNRKAVLGVEHVQRSLQNAGPFAMPWQDFITRGAWGEIWGDPTIPWKTRSMVTLAMMIALHREEEFKLHVRPALKNGVSLEELRSLLLHAAIYAGVPATNAAFRWARDVLGSELDAVAPAQPRD